MGLAGYVAGYVTSITVDPQWWLAALFTGVGAAVGELAVPVIRGVHRRGARVRPALSVSSSRSSPSGAMVLSPLLVPVGRWCLRIKRPEWKAPKERMRQCRRAPQRHDTTGQTGPMAS